MKAMTLNTANVVNTAVVCMKHDMDVATSMSKGIMAEVLQKRMMNGEVVRFVYEKKDGSIRRAIGSLQSDAVKANTVGTGVPKRYYGMFVYLDLEKMAWRGCKIEKLIGIID